MGHHIPPSHENSNRTLVAQRRAKAIKLRNQGLTWEQVAEAVPYLDSGGKPSRAAACEDVKRALMTARNELNQNLEELVQLADMRDDDLRRRLYTIMSRKHPLIQNGKIVKIHNEETGEEETVNDLGPVFAAIDRLLKVEDRYTMRHGLNAPEKLNVALERRQDLESAVVAEAILAGFDAAGLEPQSRMLALEAAQSHLRTIDGEVVEETTESGD